MLAIDSSISSCGVGSKDVGLEMEADLGLWLPGLADFRGEKSSVFRGIGPRWDMTFGCWYERDRDEIRLPMPGLKGTGDCDGECCREGDRECWRACKGWKADERLAPATASEVERLCRASFVTL
jgi:hypothetical protein